MHSINSLESGNPVYIDEDLSIQKCINPVKAHTDKDISVKSNRYRRTLIGQDQPIQKNMASIQRNRCRKPLLDQKSTDRSGKAPIDLEKYIPIKIDRYRRALGIDTAQSM
ncbi:MAG: hypothetical protein A2Y53_07530 [Chloroflexi bacterium RBG_16_47_49]|nr:MAG: hypothetical protein A2Y53_07530 [Chloroflexi bacterium RBG_16_47_49]